MRARTSRIGLLSGLVAAVLACVIPPVAHADHHFISIREVFPESSGATDAEFVELQMYAAGQSNFMGQGQTIRLYSPTAQVHSQTFATNPGNGANQRTVLIANAGAATAFGVTPDYILPDTDDLDPAGGAVCFTSNTFGAIDCVSWGTFSGTLPGAHAPPETGPIPDGSSLERSIAPNCPTLLDGGDDTNSSLADFAPLNPPAPRANATAPTEASCNTLSVLRAGTGTGSVTGNGSPAISCPNTCFSFFTPAQTAELTAIPGASATFSGWTNCPTPSGMECDAPMNVSRTITANFTSTDPAPPPPGAVVEIPPAAPLPLVQTTPPPPPKKCKKGFVKRKGKCVKKRRK
jgi:hypothetical protein